VNEITLIMEILESQKDLFRHRLDKCSGNALLLVPLNQSKQIFTQGLKNDADVGRFRCLMLERVQKRYDVSPTRMIWRGSRNFGEKLDLVAGSLGISTGRLDDLEG
jgi:hypothetical protein